MRNILANKLITFSIVFLAILVLVGFSQFGNAKAKTSLSINGGNQSMTSDTLKEFEIINKKLASVSGISLNTNVFSRDSFKFGLTDPTPEDLPLATNLGRNNPFANVGDEKYISAFDNIKPSAVPDSQAPGSLDVVPEVESPTEEISTSPLVVATTPSPLTQDSATLNGTFDVSKISVAKKWFEWGDGEETMNNKTPDVTHTITRGAHKHKIVDLSPGNTYFYRLVVLTNSGETVRSEPVSFTTPAPDSQE